MLGACRGTATLWRWPIPESGARRSPRCTTAACRSASCPTPAGRSRHVLRRSGVCQVGAGAGVAVRCVVDSHVVGVAKPDPAIFDHAAAHFAGIDRSRIAYVGDSVTMDVAGATAAGLHPMLLDPYDDHLGRRRSTASARSPSCSRWFALKPSNARAAYNCYKAGTSPPMKKLLALSAVGVAAPSRRLRRRR